MQQQRISDEDVELLKRILLSEKHHQQGSQMQDQISRKFTEALLQRPGSVGELTRKFSKAFGSANDMRRTKSTGTMLKLSAGITDIKEDVEAIEQPGSVSVCLAEVMSQLKIPDSNG